MISCVNPGVAGSTGFVVQPRRWVVERARGMPRTGWLGRWRRLSKDYEALPEVSETMVTLAMIRLMLHRLIHPNRKRLPASNSHWPYRRTGIIVRAEPRHGAAVLRRSGS